MNIVAYNVYLWHCSASINKFHCTSLQNLLLLFHPENLARKRLRMQEKDVVSKELLKRITLDIARILLHMKVEQAEIVESSHPRVEERRADLVARMRGQDGHFLLHIEVQNNNDLQMPCRMLRYRSDLCLQQPEEEIRQVLLYIGKEPLRMASGITQSGLEYQYQTVDMHRIDCTRLLDEDSPDALVLAVLCDFKGRSPRAVIRHILGRLQVLTEGAPGRFRDYMKMLEILSTNRDLFDVVKEEQSMLSEVLITELPSYGLGMERGMEQGLEQGLEQGRQQGRQQGEQQMLRKLLQKRFGPLRPEFEARISSASVEELERLGEQVLEGLTLDQIFSN
ncbi:DUF4351 domain-containing protein [Acidithiobacillus sp.]|uniref:DUF4351 domain-containing protein n=1 Tax=Acidithiobacillus sp. TaxID=1872118 RepID=UPI00262C8A49|nr:DUF4351 domain-containing protein [Acidithiobacillus sp.]MDD2748516.1 DUF4351 domain-containing protein [Acidithiobacillus sp.]MDD5279337.1 DUF4351 domain-containing protein [Acidithiobacillus sp.]